MKLGFVGLGKMGARMVLKLQKEGHEVFAWNRSDHELKNVQSIKELIDSLETPRIIWSMLPAGEATENIIIEIGKFVGEGDIVIDGGNSNFKDTQRRSEKLKTKNIKYLGIGVSGGIIAATEGYPLMVGGDKSAYEFIKPILDSLANPRGGHEYFGLGGAGHFVKMIHNGIEYGIMQSLGEGFEVLQRAPYKLDLLKITKLYQKGTLVSGFMLDRLGEVLSDPSILQSIEGKIAESGEAKWTVEQAKAEKVPVEIIERSLEYRKRSQTDQGIQNSFTAKVVAALRNAFGGHAVSKRA